ncbi:CYFA0S20e01178g1_1 [Cyberlindnera fabianii]|uniref:CYFA0S20e01178g1_1 n=2 Tax=Cyberlindnera fabianii TaxID=36022 RepID=A0A061B7J4_CYBFA|nr:CYFA0S20e01178g1_1 [Cyberlindnera fabianii]
MATLHCTTCAYDGDSISAANHINTTHHYSLLDLDNDTLVKCECCSYTSIKELKLLQVGTSDLILLCDVCIHDEIAGATIHAVWNLDNGMLSLLESPWGHCAICEGTEDIMITIQGERIIVCEECADGNGIDTKLFVRRGVEGFLLRAETRHDILQMLIENSKDAGYTIPPQSSKGDVSDISDLRENDYLPNELKILRTRKIDSVKKCLKVTDAQLKSSYLMHYSVPSTSLQIDNLTSNITKLTLLPTQTLSEEEKIIKSQASFANFTPLSKTNISQLQSLHELQVKQGKTPTISSSSPCTGTGTETSNTPPKTVNQSRRPRMTYPSLFDYFRDISDHLCLETQLTIPSFTNFKVQYNAHDESTLILTIPYTAEIDALLRPQLQELDMIPFFKTQTFFIGRKSDPSIIFHCFVRETQVERQFDEKVFVDVLLESYFWNSDIGFLRGYSDLWFIPADTQVTRIMTAMLRLQQPAFQDMILGQKMITQKSVTNNGLDVKEKKWLSDVDVNLDQSKLNLSQKNAVKHALLNEVTVIRGPPGTGKTTVITQIVEELIRAKKVPVMVVAASNYAVDNIAENLLKTHPKDITRVLSRMKEASYGKDHKLADICLHHELLSVLPKKWHSLYQKFQKDQRVYGLSKNDYWQYQDALRLAKRLTLFKKTVILTTTINAASPEIENNITQVPTIIMDESTQSSEATSLIPLSLPKVKKMIFIGDENQLNCHSTIPFLEFSLFERILKNGTYPSPIMLNTQYRMHPEISTFPNREFYQGNLLDGVTSKDRKIHKLRPIVFFDTTSQKESLTYGGDEEERSYMNVGEASSIVGLIASLHTRKAIPLEDIAVITPYSGQRDLIATMIRDNKTICPNKASILEDVETDTVVVAGSGDGKTSSKKRGMTIKTVMGITISSIDAFQGREKNLVLLSCVRSNEDEKVGFLNDRRRLNVALTRAKSSLIILGSKRCLSTVPTWKRLLDELEKKGRLINEP